MINRTRITYSYLINRTWCEEWPDSRILEEICYGDKEKVFSLSAMADHEALNSCQVLDILFCEDFFAKEILLEILDESLSLLKARNLGQEKMINRIRFYIEECIKRGHYDRCPRRLGNKDASLFDIMKLKLKDFM